MTSKETGGQRVGSNALLGLLRDLAADPEACTRGTTMVPVSQATLAQAADEIERLRDCLRIANNHHECFERKWYLRGDEIDRLRAQNERLLLALRDLYDEQNDAPLERYRKRWAATMERVRAVLADLEAPNQKSSRAPASAETDS